jgi:hypothetical protein
LLPKTFASFSKNSVACHAASARGGGAGLGAGAGGGVAAAIVRIWTVGAQGGRAVDLDLKEFNRGTWSSARRRGA